MSKIIFKKLHKNAIIPTRGTDGAAGFDLYSLKNLTYMSGEFMDDYDMFSETIPTGVAISIPNGFAGIIKDRSSVALNRNLVVSGGVIDSDYRGEVKIILRGRPEHDIKESYIRRGEKIAQIIFVPVLTDFEVGEIDETERGTGGFGSTGK